MDKKEKLFEEPRWNKYQHVEMLKTEVKSSKEDDEKKKDFRKFIDEKKGTKKK